MPSASATYSNIGMDHLLFPEIRLHLALVSGKATLICVYEKPMKYMYARTYFHGRLLAELPNTLKKG